MCEQPFHSWVFEFNILNIPGLGQGYIYRCIDVYIYRCIDLSTKAPDWAHLGTHIHNNLTFS